MGKGGYFAFRFPGTCMWAFNRSAFWFVFVLINKCEMLSSKFSFSIDGRSKIRHVFAVILNFEKKCHKNK